LSPRLPQTIAEIREETGFEAAELMILDLSMFASVSSFVEAFEQSHDRLDILVCNAAIGTSKYHKSPDGWETT
jgi:retinol dehydrogenase-12